MPTPPGLPQSTPPCRPTTTALHPAPPRSCRRPEKPPPTNLSPHPSTPSRVQTSVSFPLIFQSNLKLQIMPFTLCTLHSTVLCQLGHFPQLLQRTDYLIDALNCSRGDHHILP